MGKLPSSRQLANVVGTCPSLTMLSATFMSARGLEAAIFASRRPLGLTCSLRSLLSAAVVRRLNTCDTQGRTRDTQTYKEQRT